VPNRKLTHYAKRWVVYAGVGGGPANVTRGQRGPDAAFWIHELRIHGFAGWDWSRKLTISVSRKEHVVFDNSSFDAQRARVDEKNKVSQNQEKMTRTKYVVFKK